MALNLQGANVVVTGGTGALGRAVVARLVESGAVCHIPNLVAEELTGLTGSESGPIRIVEGVDLTDEDAVTRFYAGLPPLWASVHVAGGFDMSSLLDTSAAAFERQFRMNTLTCFLCTREAVRSIRRRSGAPGGRIVNVAARPALEPRSGAGMAAYTVSKAGVAALTQALGEELAADAILVNAVAPSIIDTPANRAAMPDADHNRWPKSEDIAAVIAFLASPENRTARGGVVSVYGRS
ncbi:SDR family NAD(P)-dependent oxidoreductase [Azospirillum sp. INR13]|uniref:SDR family NAD(P)-dependent oxidoreductase n=1 Tax=Azospirillum sp. INR13 TaxID=2596919 RepID=UPI0018927709|nr:SDR family NAD(P)-dependent oxidoreductase [Azospirillum sp. INR13]MBF5094165.1 SDR family NAD(P)-dependent oxidoreductase [Azospirillum sp. INR13]